MLLLPISTHASPKLPCHLCHASCCVAACGLHRQAQALSNSLVMHLALSPVLRELWLAYLAHPRLLEPASLTWVAQPALCCPAVLLSCRMAQLGSQIEGR